MEGAAERIKSFANATQIELETLLVVVVVVVVVVVAPFTHLSVIIPALMIKIMNIGKS